MDMTLFEVDEAANRIRKEVDTDATIIFGSAFDERLEGVMRVSVVATGISAATQSLNKPSLAADRPIAANVRPSTIVPNPVASFLPATPAVAEAPTADDASPIADTSASFDTASADSAAAKAQLTLPQPRRITQTSRRRRPTTSSILMMPLPKPRQ